MSSQDTTPLLSEDQGDNVSERAESPSTFSSMGRSGDDEKDMVEDAGADAAEDETDHDREVSPAVPSLTSRRSVWPPRVATPPPTPSPYAALELTVSERTWLRRACNERRPPEPLPNPQPFTSRPYQYWLCNDPIMQPLSRNLPRFQRDCQIVAPLETTEDMLPFITCPDTDPPVAVIPRARVDDPLCDFCRPLPRLTDIHHLCGFHMVYSLGSRYSEEFRLAGGLVNAPGGGIRFSHPGGVRDAVRTTRDLIYGSTPEAQDDPQVLENQRRATAGEFGHVGLGRPGAPAWSRAVEVLTPTPSPPAPTNTGNTDTITADSPVA
ncbi:hypothetical protein GGS26DRAFT_588916 [Hypomontagnella submonticulosa]|nr:hypothetical protein GGS26DRAFT_588916 [Hypomontagnella submonticulosa]